MVWLKCRKTSLHCSVVRTELVMHRPSLFCPLHHCKFVPRYFKMYDLLQRSPLFDNGLIVIYLHQASFETSQSIHFVISYYRFLLVSTENITGSLASPVLVFWPQATVSQSSSSLSLVNDEEKSLPSVMILFSNTRT